MINQQFNSPNFDNEAITVNFAIVHYTALSLSDSLDVLCNRQKKVSCHFLIDTKGIIYELVPAIAGTALRAWHAGVSYWHDGKKQWSDFNSHALGIELVNYNGNIFNYTQAQYQALAKLLASLKTHYPALALAANILGHEHIAGFRGKVDPGIKFDWNRFFSLTYPEQPIPQRLALLHKLASAELPKLTKINNQSQKQLSQTAKELNNPIRAHNRFAAKS